MIFNRVNECRITFSNYKRDELHDVTPLTVQNIVFYMGSFLQSVNDGVLQEHVGVDVDTRSLLEFKH